MASFVAGYVGKSFNITTNDEEACYLISKQDFIDLVVTFMNEGSRYTRSTFKSLKDHYLINYIHATYSKVVSSASLSFLKAHFTSLIRDLHKLIEQKLAEENF